MAQVVQLRESIHFAVCLNSIIRRSSNTYAIAREISHYLLPLLWFLCTFLGRALVGSFFLILLLYFFFLFFFLSRLCCCRFALAIFNFSHKLQNSHNNIPVFSPLHIYKAFWHSLHGCKNEGNDSVYYCLFGFFK